MKTKKSGILTKLVILALLVITATALLNLRGRLVTAQADLEQAQSQVADQTQINADLADAVENSGDPERQADVARSKLGLASPGERIFYFTN